MRPARAVVLGLLLLLAGRGAKAGERVEAGPLVLEVRISRTAHLFHVVDQLSECLADYQGRVCRYALALRPLVRECLDDPDARLPHMLDRAVEVWWAVTSLEPAIMGAPPPPSPDG